MLRLFLLKILIGVNIYFSMLLIVFELKSTSLDFYNVDVKLKIGQRIKELRDAKGMAQKDLAYAADLDRSYIASIENGQRNVSIVNIEKIAKAFGVTLKDFFNYAEFDKH
jgi:DNA-binding XRE family transcriptional regulator